MPKPSTSRTGKTWFRFLRRSRYRSSRLLIFGACRQERANAFLELLAVGGEAPAFDFIGKYSLQHPQMEKQFSFPEDVTHLSLMSFFPVLFRLLGRRYDTAVLIAGTGNWRESRNLLALAALLPAKNILIVGKRFSLLPLGGSRRLAAAFSVVIDFLKNAGQVMLLALAFILLPGFMFTRRRAVKGPQRYVRIKRNAVGYLVEKTRLNPYLILLTQALEKSGTSTVSKVPLKISWLWHHREEVGVLHFQWINAHFPSPEFWKQLKELTGFLWFLIIARLLGYRLVTTHHNLWPHEVTHALLFYLGSLFTLHACDGVVVHTDSGCKELARLYLLSKQRMHYVPHPAYQGWYPNTITRERARQGLNLPERSFCYLFFGLIREYKGLDTFLQAIREDKDQNAVFLIAGEPAQASVGSRIVDASLQDPRIRVFLRYIPEEEVQVFFNAADVAVLPYKEVFGSGSLLLALTFGKPLITSDLYACRDLISPKEGILVPAGDAQALAQALSEIQRRDLIEMGKASLAVAARCAVWNDYARKIQEITHAK